MKESTRVTPRETRIVSPLQENESKCTKSIGKIISEAKANTKRLRTVDP